MVRSAERRRLFLRLLLDFRELTELLSGELAPRRIGPDDDAVASAFYLAAGIHQILEDYLHRDAFVLRKAAARLETVPLKTARLAAWLATSLAAAAQAARSLRPRERRLARCADHIAGVLFALARAVVNHDETSQAFDEARRLWAHPRAVLDEAPMRLRRTIGRLPNVSYKLDQLPEDSCELVRKFTARWSDRTRPILVVGVRTSGTYLAPLYVMLLRSAGYRTVEMLTVRPRQSWRRAEGRRVREVVRRSGLMLIVDDPPDRGNVVAQVAQEFQNHGAARESLVLSLPLLGPAESLPAVLQSYHITVLPWRDWAIHRQLEADSVREVLEEMLAGREIAGPREQRVQVASVAAVERVDREENRDSAPHRGHVYAAYSAVFVDANGVEFEQEVSVDGVGRAYFGWHRQDIATALEDYLPEVYGVKDGLLYQRRLPSECAIDEPCPKGLEDRVVSYILERRERLGVDVDAAARVTDRSAAWELVADILGRALAGPWKSLVYPLTHRATRHLLKVERPSVIDGAMKTSAWLIPPGSGPGSALKTIWRGSPRCYDAAYDLAAAAASLDVEELVRGEEPLKRSASERLLETYRSRSADEVDAERLLLYQLLSVHERLADCSRGLASLERLRAGEGARVRRADADELARQRFATERALVLAYQRYLAGVFFEDLVPPADGPLCAIDIDWVLETPWYDFPAIAPAGALALRALIRHGYRPVLATARSLGEVQTRCRLFRLAGGVAEFGSVVYDHASGRVHSQVGRSEEDALGSLRDGLRSLPGVYLDHAWRHGVRAVRISEHGERRGLHDEQIETALDSAGALESVQALRGGGQTDFAPASLSKGTGLQTLARELGADSEASRPLAFAVGDGWPDIPMLALAEKAFAPANMSKSLRRQLPPFLNVKVTRDPYAAGLFQAVASFLGHDPRRCSVCAPPPLSSRQRLLVTALAGSDGPRRTRIRQAAVLTLLLRRLPAHDDVSSDLDVELLHAARRLSSLHRSGHRRASTVIRTGKKESTPSSSRSDRSL